MSRLIVILYSLLLFSSMQADQFDLPGNNSQVVGKWQIITVGENDSINALAYANDISGSQLVAANPEINNINHIHVGQKLLIPRCYQLPPVQQGIVINLAEHALFYFPNSQQVWVFPITIGKDVSPTPRGIFKVIKKSINPPWFPTANVRAEFAKKGIILPIKMPPGPKNPLGKYVLYLNTSQYWIHTTPSISELGGNRSFGCVRLYQKDIEQLYNTVALDTPVRIINIPVNYLSIAKQCLPATTTH